MTFGLVRGSMNRDMSSLYRQYRPNTFTDVLGQDHICSSLVAALKKGRVGHAYLFSGPRGTGKTTLARLYARAINCQKRDSEQNPCGTCAICREIADGKAVDVLEIDAASNRGIDEIRELRDRIAFAPAQAAYKVYIIDEVHMLTKEAFNALLKTLEEPPAHVVFILATTELHKVPETIISRCQRFAFHRASTEALTNLLKSVAKKEKVTIDEEGIQAVVSRADGSYRDALTLLGNLTAHEGSLDGQTVREMLGLPQKEVVSRVLEQVVTGQPDALAEVLRTYIADGLDVSSLAKAVADTCKDQILHKQGAISATHAAQVLEEILLTLARARTSTDPTALVAANLLGLALKFQPATTRTAPAITPPAMRDVQPPVPVVEEVPVVDTVTPTPVPTPPPKPSQPAAGAEDFWPHFLEGIKGHNHALYMVIRSAALDQLTDDAVVIAVKFKFYVDRLTEIRNKKIIETVAAEVAGRPVRLECVIRADLAVVAPTDDLVRTVVDVFEVEESK